MIVSLRLRMYRPASSLRLEELPNGEDAVVTPLRRQ